MLSVCIWWRCLIPRIVLLALTWLLALDPLCGAQPAPSTQIPPDRGSLVIEKPVPSPPNRRERIIVGLPSPIATRGLLVYTTERDIDGFAVRLVNEAASLMGVEIEYRDLSGVDNFQALVDGSIDALAPLSVQEPRLTLAEYSSPIFFTRGAVYHREGTPAASTASELRGSRVGVASNGVAHEWCLGQNISIMVFQTVHESLEGVRDGIVDFALTTQVAGRADIERFQIRGLRETCLDEPSFGRAYAIGVRKGDLTLAADLSAAFEQLRANGRYDALYEQWLEPYQPRGVGHRVPSALIWGALAAGGAAILAAGSGWWAASRRANRRGTALAASEARYRGITDASPALVYSYLVRPDGSRELRFANPQEHGWRANFPFLDLQAEYTASIRPHIHPDDVAQYDAAVVASRAGPARFDCQFRLRDRDGLWRSLHTTARPERRPEGVVWHAVTLDITELRMVQERVKESEAKYRAIFDQCEDAIILFKPEGEIIIDANERALAIYGYARDQFVGRSLERISTNPSRGRMYIEQMLGAGRPVAFQTSQRRADGTTIDIDVRGSLVVVGGRRCILTINRDVTDLRRAAEALEHSEARLAAILRAIPDIVLGLDARGHVVDVHGTDPDVLYADLRAFIGRCVNEVLPAPVAAGLLEAAARASLSAKAETFEYDIDLASGSRRFEARLVAATDGSTTAVIRDITEREEARRHAADLERSLQHARRVESLGVMAGGIAHDFNNLLAGIAGNAELAVAHADNDRVRRPLDAINTACRHAADLTHQLLAYAGKSVIRPVSFDLAQMVQELVAVLAPRLAGRVDVELAPAPIRGDLTLIRQTVMNVLVNAADAIEGRDARVSVRVGIRQVAAEELARSGTTAASPGRHAFVCVADSGPGMDPEIVSHIFEPFFSTKPGGRGLGLSVAERTAIEHRGALLVDSTPGQGTTFTLLLPVSSEPSTIPVSTSLVHPPQGSRGRALVVDDQPLVLNVAQRMLERGGWTTIGAASAAEALDILSRQGPFDLALVDLAMPGGSGAEVVRRGRQLHPAQHFVLMSGYRSGEIPSDCPFLLKPFTLDELCAAIDACTVPTPNPPADLASHP
ncbi:MAG: PAS domain S-box protein [Phycisphaerales bacterium]